MGLRGRKGKEKGEKGKRVMGCLEAFGPKWFREKGKPFYFSNFL
jgi:hypothetical protein